MLFSASSLKSILGSRKNASEKSKGRAAPPLNKNDKATKAQEDALIMSIIREETGVINPKRMKQSFRNREKKMQILTQSSKGGLERAKMVRMQQNNIFTYGSDLSMSADDIKYLDGQLRFVTDAVYNNHAKLITAHKYYIKLNNVEIDPRVDYVSLLDIRWMLEYMEHPIVYTSDYAVNGLGFVGKTLSDISTKDSQQKTMEGRADEPKSPSATKELVSESSMEIASSTMTGEMPEESEAMDATIQMHTPEQVGLNTLTESPSTKTDGGMEGDAVFVDEGPFMEFNQWLDHFESLERVRICTGLMAERKACIAPGFLRRQFVRWEIDMDTVEHPHLHEEEEVSMEIETSNSEEEAAIASSFNRLQNNTMIPQPLNTLSLLDFMVDVENKGNGNVKDTNIIRSKSQPDFNGIKKKRGGVDLNLSSGKSLASLNSRTIKRRLNGSMVSSGSSTSLSSSVVKAGRRTPRILSEGGGSIRELRDELHKTQKGLEKLNTVLESNIEWVHNNCDSSLIKGSISTGAREKCRKIACDRFATVLGAYLQKLQLHALRHWSMVLKHEEYNNFSRQFSKLKSIEIITRTVSDSLIRQYLKCWKPWVRLVMKQQRWEQECAVMEMQRVVRGRLGRLRYIRQLHDVNAVPIQCMFRKMHAKIVVEKRRIYLEYLRIYNAARRVQRLFENNLQKKKAKRVVLRKRMERAAVMLQKIARGIKGRERFEQKKQAVLAAARDRQRQLLAAEEEARLKAEAAAESARLAMLASFQAADVQSEPGTPEEEMVQEPVDEPVEPVDEPVEPAGDAIGDALEAEQPEPMQLDLLVDPTESELKSVTIIQSMARRASSKAVVQKKREEKRSQRLRVLGKEPEPVKEEKPLPASHRTTPVSSPSPKTVQAASPSPKLRASPLTSFFQDAVDKPVSPTNNTMRPISAGENIRPSSASKIANSILDAIGMRKTSKDTEDDNTGDGIADSEGGDKSSRPSSAQYLKSLFGKKSRSPSPSVDRPASAEDPRKSKTKSPTAALSGTSSGRQHSGRKSVPVPQTVNEEESYVSPPQEAPPNDVAERPVSVPKFPKESTRIEKDPSPKPFVEPEPESEPILEPVSTVPELLVPEPVKPDVKPSTPTNPTVAKSFKPHPEPVPEPVPERVPEPQTEPVQVPAKKGFSVGGLLSNIGIPGFSKSRPESAASRPVSAASGGKSTPVLSETLGASRPTSSGDKPSPVKEPNAAPGEINAVEKLSESSPEVAPNPEPAAAAPEEVQENVPPVVPKITEEEAARRLQARARIFMAMRIVRAKRKFVQGVHRKAMLMIHWAVVTVQRMIRAKIGRNRFMAYKIAAEKDRAKMKIGCAIKIQKIIRGVLGRERVKKIKLEIEKQRIRDEYANYGKKKAAINTKGGKITSTRVRDDDGEEGHMSLEEREKIEAVEKKLKKLEALELEFQAKQQKMDEATRLANERALAMENAVKDLQAKADKAEAEAMVRRQMEEQMNNQLMALAAGPITGRSDFASPSSVRKGGLTARSGPPTARSARGGAAITPDTIKLRYKGEDWAKLWDPDEKAWYWYNESTQAAQWEMPGEDPVSYGYESGGALTDYSTDGAYESGGEITDGEGGDDLIIVTKDGSSWTEFWDEAAQAKYWYNYATGEATWARPEAANAQQSSLLSSARSQIMGSARGSAGGDGVPQSARAGDGMGDWASYIDEATGQEFWYNTATGETSWA